jgi:hypothetical protein
VQVIVFGGLSVLSLIMGPLFYFGLLKDANNRNAPHAGIMLSIMGMLFLSIFCLALFNILARRQPLIRLYREGLELNILGSSTLDKVIFLPGIIRVAWLLISLQGFKRKIYRIPWHCYHVTRITGLPMCKIITFFADIFPSDASDFLTIQAVTHDISFPQVAFKCQLDQISDTIREYSSNEQMQFSLKSWNDR